MAEEVSRIVCLDVGCGSGRSYKFNPHCPIHTETVFLDLEFPTNSVRKFITARASLHFVVGDACKMPFRSDAAHLIYTVHVVEHMHDTTTFLYEVRRILRQDGELYLEFPTIFSMDLYRDPSHRQRLHYLKVLKIARRLGFTVVLRQRIGTSFPTLIRKIVNLVLNLLIDHLQLILRKSIKTDDETWQ